MWTPETSGGTVVQWEEQGLYTQTDLASTSASSQSWVTLRGHLTSLNLSITNGDQTAHLPRMWLECNEMMTPKTTLTGWHVQSAQKDLKTGGESCPHSPYRACSRGGKSRHRCQGGATCLFWERQRRGQQVLQEGILHDLYLRKVYSLFKETE